MTLSYLADVLAALDRWKEWKRMREAPDRLDAIEARLAKLEAKAPVAAGRTCPACGQPAMRRVSVRDDPGPFGVFGQKLETWVCSNCGDGEELTAKGAA